MKLIDKLKGKPATAPATPDTSKTPKPSASERLEKVAAVLAASLLAISIVWVFMFAWDNVYTLFASHLSAEPFTAMLAAGASVGMLAVLLMVTFGIRHNRMRGLATLYAAGWFAIVVSLVAVKTLFDAAGSQNANLIDLANSILDTVPWLENVGSVLAAILAGICIAPVASMFGAAKHPADDMTEDEARARYAWNAGKLIISGASIGLAVLFGAQVIGINVFVAVLLGLVLDVGFIVALQKAESSASAGDHRHAGTWTKFVWVYGVLIALMAVETIPALAKLMGTPVDVPGITDNTFLHSLGRFAYIGAIGMGILTIVLTATSSIRQKRDATGGAKSVPDGVPFTVKAAAAIDRQKQGLDVLKKSIKPPAKTNPALPAGTTLSAKSVPGGAEWQVTKDGHPVASGNAASLDAAKAAANSAAGSWLGKFVFVFNGESDYDEGGAIKSRADELLGEIGMRVKHGSPVGLEFWMFDKESFTSALKLVNGQPMQVSIGALTAQCSVTGFTRAADGSVTHAEVAADVFWDVAKANMTDAEARRLLDGAIHKQDDELNPKTSENGVKYGTTGSVVDAPAKGWPTPEELAAHRKWVEDNAKKSTRQ